MSVVSSEWHTRTLYNKKHFRFLPYLLPTDKCTSIFCGLVYFFMRYVFWFYKSPKFWFRMFRISQDIYTAKCHFLIFFRTVKLSTFIYLFTIFFFYPIPMGIFLKHNFKYIYTYTTIRKLISWRKRTCGNFSARCEIRTAMYASWHIWCEMSTEWR